MALQATAMSLDAENNTAEKLQDTIGMFEQILEVMPDDEMALRTLYDAYTQSAQHDQAFAMLNRLAEVVIEEGDLELVVFLIKQFELHEERATDATTSLLARLRSLSPSDDEAVSDSGEGEAETDALPEIRPPLVGPDDRKDAEVNLAWTLFQEGQLSQEDYSQALQDLTAMESKSVNVPITVLHVLWDRSYSHFSGLVTHLSRKFGIPFLSLSGFELQEELYLLLPLDFVQHNAAICFKRIGAELLFVVLNPLDVRLKETLQEMTGRRCHTFLVTPEEYDELLQKVTQAYQSLLGV